MKSTGKPGAGKRHAGFDVAGAGNVTTGAGLRAIVKTMESPPDPTVGAPVLDPTCERLGGRFPGATRLVCAFELQADAERYDNVLANRLKKFGLEVAAEKTNLIRFSPVNWEASGAFEFLGFEFRWGRGRWGKPVIKRRTARKKYRASLASFQDGCRKHCRRPKAILFAKLNAKLRGYYPYYGIRGNFESLADLYYQAKRLLFRTLNRRSQRRSYNWKGFEALIKVFRLQRPRICHDF